MDFYNNTYNIRFEKNIRKFLINQRVYQTNDRGFDSLHPLQPHESLVFSVLSVTSNKSSSTSVGIKVSMRTSKLHAFCCAWRSCRFAKWSDKSPWSLRALKTLANRCGMTNSGIGSFESRDVVCGCELWKNRVLYGFELQALSFSLTKRNVRFFKLPRRNPALQICEGIVR